VDTIEEAGEVGQVAEAATPEAVLGTDLTADFSAGAVAKPAAVEVVDR
jgi:hypothetical protein